MIECSIWDSYPEKTWPKEIGVASWRWVLPNLIILLNSKDFLDKDFFIFFKLGNNLSFINTETEIFKADGKVSFVD